MNNNQGIKLYQQNFPGMNLPSEEQILHSAPKITPAKDIAALCAECSVSPATSLRLAANYGRTDRASAKQKGEDMRLLNITLGGLWKYPCRSP